MSSHVKSFAQILNVKSCQVMSSHVKSCQVMSSHVKSCQVMSLSNDMSFCDISTGYTQYCKAVYIHLRSPMEKIK